MGGLAVGGRGAISAVWCWTKKNRRFCGAAGPGGEELRMGADPGTKLYNVALIGLDG